MAADREKQERHQGPVAWLLSEQLLSGLKWIAAYSAFGDKTSPLDWMVATETIQPPQPPAGDTEYWFDFIADTGDGTAATYTIAYLCMSDLWLDSSVGNTNEAIALTQGGNYQTRLPRGQFLFVGGDTAYHIADAGTLMERFQAPFNWAYEDLSEVMPTQVEQRPIYAIPANHDYYDALDGFNRQFLKPFDLKSLSTSAEQKSPFERKALEPQLGLKGFKRMQSATYMALSLPWDWKLWGLDTQRGILDKRQSFYFESTLKGGEVPRKLVVVTPEPSTVLGCFADRALEPRIKANVDDAKNQDEVQIAKSFALLNLEPCFLTEGNGRLPPGKCRLDISGDTHHYARYWGPSRDNTTVPNYASVVAGGGGAFVHPTHTRARDIEPRVLYPSAVESHVLFTRSVMNVAKIKSGGYVWLAGLISAVLTYLSQAVNESTWWVFPKMFDTPTPQSLTGSSFLARVQQALNTTDLQQQLNCCDQGYVVDLVYASFFLAFLVAWSYFLPRFFKSKGSTEPDWFRSLVSMIASLHAQWQRTWLSAFQRYKGILGRYPAIERFICSKVRMFGDPDGWQVRVLAFVTPVILVSMPLLVFQFWTQHPQPPTPLTASMMIVLWSVSAILLWVLNRRYSDVLIEHLHQNARGPRGVDSLPLWTFGLLSVLTVSYGFLRYGVYEASPLTLNMVMIILWAGTCLALIYIAVSVGAQLHRRTGKILFGAFGLLHACVQLLTPAFLALYASLSTITAVTLLAVLATRGVSYLVASDRLIARDGSDQAAFTLHRQTTVGCVLLSIWMALLAIVVFAWDPMTIDVTLFRVALAGALGAVYSCLWFGWYLAISIAFNGHNNEAGGGARSDSYRHLVRICLKPDSLTAYVIGFEHPAQCIDAESRANGSLRFRLVDRFELRCSG